MTITVNTLIDELDSNITDGDVSLRDALAAAAAGETIVFDPALVAGGPASIDLALGELVVRRSLTILGPGANLLTVDAQNASRVVSVDDGNSGNLSNVGIIGLTFTGGNVTGFQYGGGIRNLENLTVTECSISDNSTSFTGGGIWNGPGSLTIFDSTLANNSALHGGGVFTGASLNAQMTTIIGSTISGNTATGSGGGMFNRYGTASIHHTTITDNSAAIGSGVASYSSNLTQTSVYSTIIAGNSGSDVDLFGGVTTNSFHSDGYNLIGDGNALTAFDNDDETGITDPGLGPLVNNGGPTLTHAVLLNSPAFNTGDPGFVPPPDLDQRGGDFLRVTYGQIDIGSLEARFDVAASLTVDSLLDELDSDIGPGDLSLREAVTLANLDPNIQIIGFAPALTGNGPATISLSLGELAIANPVSIVGPGARQLAIDASPNSRIFNINRGSAGSSMPIDVHLSGVTLTGGRATNFSNGGAILNRENLTVSAAIISGNVATGRGGGIYSRDGNLTVVSSTISGNSGGQSGGGVDSRDGSLIVKDSLIWDNSASLYGGGVLSRTVLAGQTATIENSTFSENTAGAGGGGFFNLEGVAEILHSTFTDNTAPAGGGSGVAAFALDTETTINSSIIANNNQSDIDFIGKGSNPFVSTGYNLVGSGNAVGAFNQTGDRRGVSDLRLGPLADNGGPTRTHALLVGSPAINAGDPIAMAGVEGVPQFDQRGSGFARVQHGRIDIGAYEVLFNVGATLVVDTLADELDGNLGAGDLALREALWLANLGADTQTINFAAALTNGGPATSTLSLLELPINNPVNIVGPGANLLTIHAGGKSRVFVIDNGSSSLSDVEVRGLTLTGGNVGATGDGGAIHSRENLSVIECIVSGNTAIDGAGIYNRDGNLTVSRSTVSQNVATQYGGGIHSRDGNLAVIDSTISGNSANSAGGIVSTTNLTNQSAIITSSTISGNTSTTRAGGVLNLQGRTSIRNSTVTRNTAPAGAGGGVASFGNNATQTSVLSSIIAGNTNSDVNFVSGGINSLVSLGFNLIGSGSGLAAFNQPGDQTGVANPQLGPLEDNGGPTRTHALLLNSPAINGGNPASIAGMDGVPAFDQRGSGFARVIAGIIDIGAFESQNPDLVVDRLADESDGIFSPGDLSLREAIEIANFRKGTNTVSFAASLTSGGPATISLAVGELAIRKSMMILGPGANLLRIDAHDASRVFNVDDGLGNNTSNVVLTGLALINGNVNGFDGGGGILNREKLTIVDSVIAHNMAVRGGGIATSGDVMLLRSVVSDNSAVGSNGIGAVGGGIHVLGNELTELSVVASAIDHNTAGAGGGIWQQLGKTSIAESSITHNSASAMGSAGGILNISGNVLVSQSTISGNSAGATGGGIVARSVEIAYSTLTDNHAGDSGGIAAGTLLAASSIIAGNTVTGEFPDVQGGTADVTALFSLIGDGTGVVFSDSTGSRIGTQESPINPLLAPLDFNGGPVFSTGFETLTHALLPGSPAVNAGDPASVAGMDSVPAFDQRGNGFPRVQHGRIDIGAFEALFTVGHVLTVDTLVDELDGNIDTGDMALREALWLANLNADPQAIGFAASLTSGGPAVSTLALGELQVINSVAINGPGANLLTIDAAGKSRVFHISDGTSNQSDVQLRGLTLTGGNVAGFKYGGGILNRENLTLATTTIRGNTTSFLGGGIWTASGNLIVTESTISGNSASHGAGIFSGANGGPGTTSIVSSSISGNTASVSGGGMLNMQGITAITRSTITRNAAPAGGGSGISSYGSASTQTIIRSTIVSGNTNSDVDRFGGTGGNSFHSDGYNLIGSGNALAAFANHDLVGVTNPQLGPLADNGGPTMTHALAAGSRAFDAGDPSAVAGVGGVPMFDQRGPGFPRVFNGRIDIGAFESQIILPPLAGDYDDSGVVDTADYVVWRRARGSVVPPYTGADGNGDGAVDDVDYLVWRANFGIALGTSAEAGGLIATATSGALDRLNLVETSAPTPAVSTNERTSKSLPGTAASGRQLVGDFRFLMTDRQSTGGPKSSRHASAPIVELTPREEHLLAALRKVRPGINSSAEQSGADSDADDPASSDYAEHGIAVIDLAFGQFGEGV